MGSESITFTVSGVPKPGGSKRAFVKFAKSGKAYANITDDSGKGGTDWRGDVKSAALAAYRGDPMDTPLSLTVVFIMPRPSAHWRKNGALKPNAPSFHAVKPDATKLLRSLEDALTGIIWRDDSRIVEQNVTKRYGTKPGAEVTVTVLTATPAGRA